MNAYDIIIEKGYLGALKYADSIESSNITLASEIDNAVTELYKNASGIGMVKTAQSVEGAYPMPNYTPFRSAPQTYSPSAAPGPTQQRTFSPYQPKQAPDERWNTGLGGLQNVLPGVAKYQAVMNTGRWAWHKKTLADLQKLVAKIPTASTTARVQYVDEAAKILASVPRMYINRGGKIVELIDTFIDVLPPTGATTPDILKKAINYGFRPPPKLTNLLWNNPLARKLMNAIPGGEMHPLFETWNKRVLTDAQKVLIPQLKGKTPLEAIEFLNASGKEGQTLARSLQRHISKIKPDALKGIIQNQIGKVNPKAVGTGTGALIQEFFIAVGTKYPMLKGVMGVISKVGKFLGPLAVAFEGKGLWDHVSKYGWDARAVCLGLSTLLGIASLVPAWTPFIGPIWAVVSIGCAILTPEQAEQKKTELYKDLTNDKIKSIKDTVNFNSLSPKDQVIVTEILNTAQGDPQKIQSLVAEAKQSQKFENPLNSLAVIYGEWERNGKIN